MNTEEIEGNELINKFMGLHRQITYEDGEKPIEVYKGLDGFEGETGRSLKYHSDWNWLIPVVEKIESINSGQFGFNIYPGQVHIIEYVSGKEDVVVDIQTEDEPRIATLYYAVVQFIRWYNTQSL